MGVYPPTDPRGIREYYPDVWGEDFIPVCNGHHPTTCHQHQTHTDACMRAHTHTYTACICAL
eukprot:NODE_376_length_947_cov_135.056793_g327_i0.p9 GENE.NODE_376_length_947_cov_135.056793_g327_i0~~NODE_376_length_947_cov_135.056793_g327_i0.p9  ORF type:complete len:62 (-),score=14.68 NODE_376_length_947_cov_135.056793_g327_i0:370-555(-)